MKLMLPIIFTLTLLQNSAFAQPADPHAADRQALIKVFQEIEAGTGLWSAPARRE